MEQKRFPQRMSDSERSAWQAFELTGEIGAYLLYCAMREERVRADR